MSDEALRNGLHPFYSLSKTVSPIFSQFHGRLTTRSSSESIVEGGPQGRSWPPDTIGSIQMFFHSPICLPLIPRESLNRGLMCLSSANSQSTYTLLFSVRWSVTSEARVSLSVRVSPPLISSAPQLSKVRRGHLPSPSQVHRIRRSTALLRSHSGSMGDTV